MDVRFGSLWTNISRELFNELGISYGDRAEIAILNDTREVYRNIIKYGKSLQTYISVNPDICEF